MIEQRTTSLYKSLRPLIARDFSGGGGGSFGGAGAGVPTGVYLPLNGSEAMTGNLNMAGRDIVDVDLINGVDITTLSANDNLIIAGPGLDGGGRLIDGDVEINLGLPGTLGALTANNASASSHTHAISSTAFADINPDVLLRGSGAGGLRVDHLIIGDKADNDSGIATGVYTDHWDAGPGGVGFGITRVGDGDFRKLESRTSVMSPLYESRETLELQPGNAKLFFDATEVRTPGDFLIAPGNDLFFPNSTDLGSQTHVSGLLGHGWQISEILPGKSHLDIRSIYTDELIAKTFIADEVRVRRGDDWLAPARGTLALPFVVPATGGSGTITVEDSPYITGALFASGDYVLLKTISRPNGGLIISEAWGQVYNYVAHTDNTQSWTWITRQTIASGFVVDKGMEVVGFGKSGSGYIYRTVLDAAGSPYMRVATWTDNPYTPANRTVHWQAGNLDGLSFPDMNPEGWGTYTDNFFGRGVIYASDGRVRLNERGVELKFDVAATQEAVPDYSALTWFEDIETRNQPLGGLYPYRVDYSGTSPLNTIALRALPGTAQGSSAVLEARAVNKSAELLVVAPNQGAAYIQAQSQGAFNVVVGDHVLLFAPEVRFTGNLSAYGEGGDIGKPGDKFGTLYVQTIEADYVVGGQEIGGAQWGGNANMTIAPRGAATRTLFLSNPDGVAHLDVEGNISVGAGRTVDGVDISAHANNADAHHARQHALDGADHTGNLPWDRLDKAGSSLADLATRSHADLTELATGNPHPQYWLSNSSSIAINDNAIRSVIATNGDTNWLVDGKVVADSLSIADGALYTALTNGQLSVISNAEVYVDQLSVSSAIDAGSLEVFGVADLGSLVVEHAANLNSLDVANTATAHRFESTSAAIDTLDVTTLNGGVLNGSRLNIPGAVGILIAPESGNNQIRGGLDLFGQLNAKNGLQLTGQLTSSGNELVVGSAVSAPSLALSGDLSAASGAFTANVTASNSETAVEHVIGNDSLFNGARLRLRSASINAVTRTGGESTLFLQGTGGPTAFGGDVLMGDGRGLVFAVGEDGSASYLDYAYDAAGSADLFRFRGDNATVEADDARLRNLSLASFIRDPDGNNVVRFSGKALVPGQGVSLGTTIDPFANLHVNNLVASSVVRVDSVTTVDGSFVAAPNGKLTRALISGQAQIYLDDGTRRNGEHLYIKSLVADRPQYERLTLDSGPVSVGDGEYRYDVLRDVGNFTQNNVGYNWPLGSVAVSTLLNPGEGWFEITSGQDIYGMPGPLFSMYGRHDYGYDDVQMVMAQGNVQTLVDYGSATTGFVLGNDAQLAPWEGFRGITNDPNDGVRLFNVGLSLYDDSANLAVFIDDETGIDFLLGNTVDSARSALSWYADLDNPGSPLASVVASRAFHFGENGQLIYSGSGANLVYTAATHTFFGEVTAREGLAVQRGDTYLGGSLTVEGGDLGLREAHFAFLGQGDVTRFGSFAEDDRVIGNVGSFGGTATSYDLKLLNDYDERTGEAVTLLKAEWAIYDSLLVPGKTEEELYARSDVFWSLPTLRIREKLALDEGAQLGGDWKPLLLATGWYNYGQGYQDAEYKIVGDLVLLRGLVWRSNYPDNSVIASLPALAPSGREMRLTNRLANSSNSSVRVDVTTAGKLTILEPGDGWVNLGDIIWSVN